MSDWDIAVDRDLCLGSGICVAASNGAFMLVGDRSQPAASPCRAGEEILLAAMSCPAEAITIVDVDTGRLLFPEES
ncbi:ferredoxin [Nocardia sp. NPDC049220]|uniref:ferredoxin n=1 Tax=Nocardia sp. NPDC049220 TaxID=3155273 RepID=UPI0034070219